MLPDSHARTLPICLLAIFSIPVCKDTSLGVMYPYTSLMKAPRAGI